MLYDFSIDFGYYFEIYTNEKKRHILSNLFEEVKLRKLIVVKTIKLTERS